MNAARQEWDVRLSAMARTDFRGIIDWTIERFGEGQSTAYSKTITAALRTLKAGPDVTGVKSRDDLGKGLFILPVARSGRRSRHLIVFRVASKHNARTLQVLRILHDAMDLSRHLTGDDEAEH